MGNPYLGGPWRLGKSQLKAFTTSAAINDAVGPMTQCVRVVVTAAAHVSIGPTPTATTADAIMPANVPEVFVIRPGEKVAALQVSGGGNLIVTELTR